ncbi:OST-HTH/LOTUS domain-containing protein [Ralstonia pseudosolanacearum]|uniref:OST-HTH/LOTUS domain-containing protein n=1 Tax=Ralstonia pseudosolanacearum TaxID=1310165 RepID=UPI0023DBE776|nr:OST-HTH/LOTUS domain-containing protein [Ralstonia pseudosolanacearum]
MQRKLGRCLLRLQQYETLLKSLVAHRDIAGPPAQLQAIREAKMAWVQKQTLGTLVRVLTASYLTQSQGDDAADEDESGDGGVWVRFRSQIELGPERYEAIVEALQELVNLRNELVHHFLQRFNIWEVDGCATADVHLDACYETIDGHFLTLRGWAQSMQEAWSHMASFMATPAYQDFVVNGVSPDGAVNWPTSGVVNCLRDAESRFGINGWTKLDAATAWIREQHPDQQPLRYGCGSWRQVIHESRQFETRKQSNNDGSGNEVWYRSRPTDSAS